MTNTQHEDVETQRFTHAEARNALVTANGIVLGFAIAFGIDWMRDDKEPWQLKDWWFGAPFLLSIVLLIAALGTALLPYSQTVKQYNRSACLFLSGVILAFIAILLSNFT
jgi:hypothetical protein